MCNPCPRTVLLPMSPTVHAHHANIDLPVNILLLRHEAQRPTHRRLESLMARTRTMSRNRMARSLQGHGNDAADGRLPADTAAPLLHAWNSPQKPVGVRLGRDPTTTRSCEWG